MRTMFLGALATGCVVYEDDVHVVPAPVVVPADGPPWVDGADAFVWYDAYTGDFPWTFEAWVGDPMGPYDVVDVWADVWDEWAGGIYVGSYQLLPTSDPAYYAVSVGYTGLDPYWGGYTVDVAAYDAQGSYTWITIIPATL